jgi:hypothetical protein
MSYDEVVDTLVKCIAALTTMEKDANGFEDLSQQISLVRELSQFLAFQLSKVLNFYTFGVLGTLVIRERTGSIVQAEPQNACDDA